MRCPACAYDLLGVLNQPGPQAVRVRCSECGALVDVAQLLDTSRSHVPGFVEHAIGRERITSAWRTLLWLIVPHRFWRRVHREAFRSLRACLVWLIIVLLVPRMVHFVFLGFINCAQSFLFGHLTWRNVGYDLHYAWFLQDQYPDERLFLVSTSLVFLSIGAPLVLAILTSARQRTFGAARCYLHAWIYSLTPLIAIWCARAAVAVGCIPMHLVLPRRTWRVGLIGEYGDLTDEFLRRNTLVTILVWLAWYAVYWTCAGRVLDAKSRWPIAIFAWACSIVLAFDVLAHLHISALCTMLHLDR